MSNFGIPWNKGKHHSIETREKISRANKGKPARNKGSHHTEEAKMKMSLSRKGRKLTEEWKERIGAASRGEKHWNWKGGRFLSHEGYIKIYMPNHPYAFHKYVYEHRLAVEQVIGRFLDKVEIVHHINGNKQDNRPENLQLVNHETHNEIHHPGRKALCHPERNHIARGFCERCYRKFMRNN